MRLGDDERCRSRPGLDLAADGEFALHGCGGQGVGEAVASCVNVSMSCLEIGR